MNYAQYEKYVWLLIVAISVVLLYWLIRRMLSINDTKTKETVSLWEYPFKAGDLILVSSGNIMRFFGGSHWTHTAIVFKDPRSKILYVWEVRMPRNDNFLNFIGNSRNRVGIRLSPLYKYFERYKDAKFAVRSLNKKVDSNQFMDFIFRNNKRRFSTQFALRGLTRFFGSLAADVLEPQQVETANEQRYCAELTAETYYHLGVLMPQSTLHNYIPRDFAEGTESLALAPGYHFGPETGIVFKKRGKRKLLDEHSPQKETQ